MSITALKSEEGYEREKAVAVAYNDGPNAAPRIELGWPITCS